MKIKAQNIVLRDMRESDIDDDVRWNTTETEWGLWDAPWETEEEIVGFDEDAYRKKEMESLQKPLPEHRLTFEIETADGVHIGGVSSYCIDEDCQYLSSKPDTEEERKKARWAVGLDGLLVGRMGHAGTGRLGALLFGKRLFAVVHTNVVGQFPYDWSG